MMLLEGQNVSKNFGGLMAVSQADFHVNEGEIVGLIGPNGAGKTTLFNLISGALTPRSGVIRFKGRNITRLNPSQICHMGMARTFQTTKIFGGLSAFENVRLAAQFGKRRSVSDKTIEREVNQLMAFVGLLGVRTGMGENLTVANQKRLEIARALATRPDLLLLDEVMSGLTPAELTQSMDLINRIRDQGITIFMIEHVMRAIMNVCDRIIVFHNGEKITEGTPQEVAASPTVIEIYLGESADAGSQ